MTLDGLKAFSESYINTLSKSYHFGFGVACLSLIISMLIFWGFRKYYAQADLTERQKARSEALKSQVVELTPQQTKERLIALGLVFFVVIFFWMAFHQSAVTLTYFARDYTVPSVGQDDEPLVRHRRSPLAIRGGHRPRLPSEKGVRRRRSASSGGAAFAVFAILAYVRYSGYEDVNPFTPQKFQHFNPFFIVALTPLVVAIFGWLNRKGREPSAPRKIGVGMIITAAAYSILVSGFTRSAQPARPRRPGRPGGIPSLRILAHLDLLPGDNCRALPQPDRDFLRLSRRSAQVQGPDAGRLVCGDG